MFLFCLCPVRSSLDSVLRPFFGVQNASFCVQKASLSVRAGRVRMKIHSAPFFESSSLKTRFSSKNAKILDQKQKRRKKRSLETQGIYIYILHFSTMILVQTGTNYQVHRPYPAVVRNALCKMCLQSCLYVRSSIGEDSLIESFEQHNSVGRTCHVHFPVELKPQKSRTVAGNSTSNFSEPATVEEITIVYQCC